MSKDRPNSILVTGGRGFIGRHLVQVLLGSRSETIVSVDVAPVGPRKHHKDNLVEVELDVRDTQGLREIFQQFDIQLIFDLAYIAEVGLPKKEYEQNIELTLSMTQLVLEFNVPKYVFFSSQFVFRKEGVQPRDDQDYFPIDAYGEVKISQSA